MSIRTCYVAAGLATLAAVWAVPAQAVSMKECSQMYRSARSSGTLGGMSWNEFRRANCGAGASAATKQAPAAQAPSQNQAQGGGGLFGGYGGFGGGQNTTTNPGWFGGQQKYSFGSAVFPQAVSPQYSNLSAGKARMRTCLDQYHANKASGGNAGLKWIQKGGGYYSLCNRQLKGR